MLRSNQPIVHLRTRLSQEMFGTIETNSSTNTKQWYSYYRSSIADKMSDYEDIWEKSDGKWHLKYKLKKESLKMEASRAAK